MAISLIGILIGRVILHRKHSPTTIVIVFALLIPALTGFESGFRASPQLYSTTTFVIIDRPKDRVWQEVIAFSKIGAPTEWFFKAVSPIRHMQKL